MLGKNVCFGTDTPDASAALDLTSTTKGLLPPRMTTTQKNDISSPAEGLVVYDSTLHLPYYYSGSAWSTFGTSADDASGVLAGQIFGG